ncbi:hypothetical protein NC652_010900 [Populus alba x Populus x berolinensis]|nr:hypothetical protein NC652_010893 [Populus alba x Populus x berolinensis]KAJ6936000.1 hypothetical protein NC652_010900 [Populus alba x Populus x berolinensis]
MTWISVLVFAFNNLPGTAAIEASMIIGDGMRSEHWKPGSYRRNLTSTEYTSRIPRLPVSIIL